MNVLVKAYTALNVGDDLFLHILFKRYKATAFYLYPLVHYNKYKEIFKEYNNVTVLKRNLNLIKKIFDRFDFAIFNKKDLNNYDACVYIGGSIFIENLKNNKLDKLFLKEAKFFIKNGNPYYLISCNFGPFYTDKYKIDREKVFAKCADVCFREKYSYELFKDISTVRYAPDAGFTYVPETFRFSNKIKNSIGISLINLRNRTGINKYYDIYMNSLVYIIKKCLKSNKKVYLFNFCVFEGDLDAARSLIEMLDVDMREKILIISYTGDIEKFLSIYASVETMICSRLHSLILSIIFGQSFYPISYSDKIKNIIKDLNLCKEYSVIWNMTENEGEFILNNFEKPKTIDEIKLLGGKAEQQFEKLDLILK